MNTRTEQRGTIAPGDTFTEVGTIEHEGHSFSSGGAYVSDDRLIAYLGDGEVTIPAHIERWNRRTIHVPERKGRTGDVKTWSDIVIGRYLITKTWRTPDRSGNDWHDMAQVRIRLHDGRHYNGRSQGPGMIVRAKRVASERRTA
jgi:hypothetical protein